jgi:hypothetical protein
VSWSDRLNDHVRFAAKDHVTIAETACAKISGFEQLCKQDGTCNIGLMLLQDLPAKNINYAVVTSVCFLTAIPPNFNAGFIRQEENDEI